MSLRPQPRTTFVPTPVHNPGASTKTPREAAPLAAVPASLEDDGEALEPHWLPTIDAATD